MLHGFRQTAGGFYGRSHAFRKTLRHLAKFDFLEGTFDIEPREHETLGNPGDRVKCTSAGNEMVDTLAGKMTMKTAASMTRAKMNDKEWEAHCKSLLAHVPTDEQMEHF